MAINISPKLSEKDSLIVRIEIPTKVHSTAINTARDGSVRSIILEKIGTKTTVKLKINPAFEADVYSKPTRDKANTINNRKPCIPAYVIV